MKRRRDVGVFIAESPQKGISKTSDILNKNSDRKTVLFLSGGSTPKALYELIFRRKTLSLGAAGVIDERYGLPFHPGSNEKMFRDSGILTFFENKNVPFYSVLSQKPDLINAALRYNKIVRKLFDKFEKRIAIMGIGEDGHTASLPAGRVQSSKFKVQKYVEDVDNFPGEFKERITLTFKALSEMNMLIILAFGSAKQDALKAMFEKGSLEEVPARFYTRPDIAPKTLLITDQKI